MANHLTFDKQLLVISALVEGSSIRAIERMTGIHRDTIMRLGVRIGQACDQLMHEKMRGLVCEQIQVDEIWGFIAKKERNVAPEGSTNGEGDVWTFVAVDPESKIVPSYLVGKRDYDHTHRFISDLAARLNSRIQLSSDAMHSYAAAVDDIFGTDVDYGQIVKVFSSPEHTEHRRYSPPYVSSIRRTTITGAPDHGYISTSHIERQNLTMRMHIRRLTRLTNAFSKKLENFQCAVALHFAYYNFVKIHTSLRVTPAMAAGVESRLWSVRDLVGLTT